MMFWPNSHRRLRQSLSAYLDGQLTAAKAEALERHLADCHPCRSELEELRAIVVALHDLPEEEIPRSFVLRPGQVVQPTQRRPVPASPVLATGMRLAGAALAFALAAVLLVDLGDLGGDGGGPMGVAETPAELAAQAEVPTPAEVAAPQPMEDAEKGAERAATSGLAEKEGIETFQEATPETAAGAAAPSPPVEGAGMSVATPDQASPVAAEPQEAAKLGGGLDPLRAAEVAIAAALGFLIIGSLTLAFASRKR